MFCFANDDFFSHYNIYWNADNSLILFEDGTAAHRLKCKINKVAHFYL